MQVALFKALKSINIDDDRATEVVTQLEEHLENMIGDATKKLEGKFNGLEAKLDAIKSGQEAQRSQITMFSILIGAIGILMTVAVAIAPTLAKFAH